MSETMRKVDVLRAACCVAGSDGQISDSEKLMLQKLALNAGVGSVSLDAMMARSQTDKNFYAEQFRILEYAPKETMLILFRVAIADGKLLKSEAIVLKRLSQRLGVAAETFDAWLKQALSFANRKGPSAES